MKLLHREDVLEAGHDLPTTGLCANIGESEMEELKRSGRTTFFHYEKSGRS